MSNRPWMPLYVADFLADTSHLSAAETGAYMLLIMHYWQQGGLPDCDRKLARIARVTPAEWDEIEPTIVEFFGPGWTHKRIDAEIARTADISEKRSAAAKARQRTSNSNASAEQLQSKSIHTHTHTHREGKGPPRGLSPSPAHTHTCAHEATRVWVDMDSPQWEAWRRYRRAQGKPGTPQTTEPERGSPGWYFETEWPPGHEKERAA
jgi:uncharacterized protein YdaU (DUF1376 family)